MDCHREKNFFGSVRQRHAQRSRISVARSGFLWRGFCSFCANRTYYFEYCQPKPLINLSKFHNLFMQFLLHARTERL